MPSFFCFSRKMNIVPRILIVDDEPQLQRIIRVGLTAHGFEARIAADGNSALATIREWRPDLIITDLSMPEMDGLSLCRQIRSESNIPIIVLSVKWEESVKVEALDAGADDYVTKPFGMDELLARVRSLLRRISVKRTEPETNTILTGGDFYIDLDSRLVRVKGKEVRLTPKEYDLLVYFMRNADKVIAQRTLLSAIWGIDYTDQPEYLRVFVNQLRKKIEPNPLKPQYILTDPWIGYRFKPHS
jgi:two-component system, OmpR family, KDP operon response regulator KdpE